MHLTHALGNLVVFGENMAMIYNVSKQPNGPDNLAPYPLVDYDLKTHRTTIVHFNTNRGELTIGRSIAAVSGMRASSIIIDYRAVRAWRLNASGASYMEIGLHGGPKRQYIGRAYKT